MKASQFFISTLKEAPADAEVASHKLMMRAGLIKKLGAGIYNYMPMGLRVIRKVESIVREEMNRAGAVECTMPVVQPAELWQETGRFDKMGPELLRIQDRHGRVFIIQPTSEEVVTDIARQELRSYKQLPKNLYQIQTKFRDERRPRFGLMRGREFIMKDAYSFDRDQAAAKASYQVMAQAYRRIFDRFGLTYRAVAADSGAIGGDLSEEFQVIAATGDDAIVDGPGCDYAVPNLVAEAARSLGATGDTVRHALTHAAVREGRKVARLEEALRNYPDTAHVVEGEPGQRAGLVVLDEDVGPVGERPRDPEVGLVAEIERDRALVAVDRLEVGRLPVRREGRPPRTGVVARSWPLDLDDGGAEVGEEHRRVGPGEDPGEVSDQQSVQRTRHARIVSNCAERVSP